MGRSISSELKDLALICGFTEKDEFKTIFEETRLNKTEITSWHYIFNKRFKDRKYKYVSVYVDFDLLNMVASVHLKTTDNDYKDSSYILKTGEPLKRSLYREARKEFYLDKVRSKGFDKAVDSLRELLKGLVELRDHADLVREQNVESTIATTQVAAIDPLKAKDLKAKIDYYRKRIPIVNQQLNKADTKIAKDNFQKQLKTLKDRLQQAQRNLVGKNDSKTKGKSSQNYKHRRGTTHLSSIAITATIEDIRKKIQYEDIAVDYLYDNTIDKLVLTLRRNGIYWKTFEEWRKENNISERRTFDEQDVANAGYLVYLQEQLLKL